MRTLPILALTSLLLWAGCDKTDNTREMAFDEFSEMTASTLGVLSLLSISVQTSAQTQGEEGLETFACPTMGEVDFELTDVENLERFIFSMIFRGCEGTSGTLDFDISSTTEGADFSLDFIVDGELNGMCRLQFNQFSQAVSIDTGAQNPTVLFTLNGDLSGTCREETFSCAFNADAYSTADGGDVFVNRCS